MSNRAEDQPDKSQHPYYIIKAPGSKEMDRYVKEDLPNLKDKIKEKIK